MNHAAQPLPPAVILDLDGTVADTLDDITSAVNYALDHQMKPLLERETVRGMIGDGLPTLMSRAGETSEEAMIAFLVRRFKEHYDEHHLDQTVLYDGAAKFLSRCEQEGILLAILSNKPHTYTLLVCDDLLDPWSFGAIVGAHDGLPIKPDPAGALAIADAMGRDPQDIWLVGDSVIDVDTARAAGMRAVAVTWGFQDRDRLQAAQPDHLVDDFEQLGDVILHSGRPSAGPRGA
ncbi:MAG: HAD family hydrolase [bacterium]|nr:HAD family hydrolase [bacterium]